MKKIKVLWLYRYFPNCNYDHWFHIDFANAINNDESFDLKTYGLKMHDRAAKNYLNLRVYNSSYTLKDLHNMWNFDVIICNTKSRMFEDYLPWWYVENFWKDKYDKPVEENMWLPSDFNDWTGPKVMLEEDYHYEKDDSWYVEKGFDIILQRHLSQVEKEDNVKMAWFPFSVDTNIFKPDLMKNRDNRICFAGSGAAHYNKIYQYRWEVCQKLSERPDLFINLKHFERDEKYISCLQNYKSHINGSSIMNITGAKMFEILSSGSLLFTDNVVDKNGLNQLYSPDCYMTYERDYSDLIPKAEQIVSNGIDVRGKAAKAREETVLKHSNPVRIKQLHQLLTKEFNL